MKETALKNRTIMSVIAIVIGLLMAAVIPFLVQTSLDRVLQGLTDHVNAGNPTFKSGIPIFDLFYPIWRAVIFVAGIALIVISQEIRKGSEWTFPGSPALLVKKAGKMSDKLRACLPAIVSRYPSQLRWSPSCSYLMSTFCNSTRSVSMRNT